MYAGTQRLTEAMREFVAQGGLLREEQTIVKARSSLCETAFDLHVTPIGGPYWSGDGRWLYMMEAANVFPLSRGTLRLAGRDPNLAPVIDHGYFTDPEDIDLTILLEAVELGRTLAGQAPLAELIGAEAWPGSQVRGDDLRTFVRANGELGANFNIGAFAHRAVWNADESRMEAYLVSTIRQQVRIPASALDIVFEPGEAIWTVGKNIAANTVQIWQLQKTNATAGEILATAQTIAEVAGSSFSF